MKGTIKIWFSFALRAILIHFAFFLLTSLNSFFLLRDRISRPVPPTLWVPLFFHTGSWLPALLLSHRLGVQTSVSSCGDPKQRHEPSCRWKF